MKIHIIFLGLQNKSWPGNWIIPVTYISDVNMFTEYEYSVKWI